MTFFLDWNSLVAQFSIGHRFFHQRDRDRESTVARFVQLCLRFKRKEKEWKEGSSKQVTQEMIEREKKPDVQGED